MLAVAVAVNFLLAGVCIVGVLLLGAVLAYGVFWSGDSGSELASGVLGTLLLATPTAAAGGIYMAAAVGLQRRARWGYTLHMVGAAMAALTCCGLVWTAAGIGMALGEDFKAEALGVATDRAAIARTFD